MLICDTLNLTLGKMYLKFTHRNLAMILFLLMIGYAVGEKLETNEEEEGIHGHHHEGHSTTPHMDHSVIVFFTPKELKAGNMIPIFFRPKKPPSSTSPHFLPSDEAELIPFSLSKLPFLLQHFGFSRASSQAQAMDDTLRQCENKPIQGETKFCATSLESMLDFVQDIFGVDTTFKALSTHEFGKSSNVLQNYTILEEPRQIIAPKMVACHTLPYPYVVYYCHYQESESKVFQIMLKGNNDNSIVEAVAVCHMDTSLWSPNHVSFRVLGTKPGSSPVCHFFPADNLVWVPIYKANEFSGDKVLSAI